MILFSHLTTCDSVNVHQCLGKLWPLLFCQTAPECLLMTGLSSLHCPQVVLLLQGIRIVLEILRHSIIRRKNLHICFYFMVLTGFQSLVNFKYARISSAFFSFWYNWFFLVKTTATPPIRDGLFLISLNFRSMASRYLLLFSSQQNHQTESNDIVLQLLSSQKYC